MSRTGLAAALLLAFGVAACASPTPGTPMAAGPRHAPPVAHPLDANKFVATPCAALTTDDLANLGFTRPSLDPFATPEGRGCGWRGEDTAAVGVSWITANKHGLSDVYASRGNYSYWQATTVAGYPAVYGSPLHDYRSSGECVLNVGVNDHLEFYVDYTDPVNTARACPAAARAAAAVISNVRGSA
jgi:hypothetical protein